MRRATVLAVLMLAACSAREQETAPRAQASATGLLAATDAEGYARVLAGRPFEFPADHASHDAYRSEWWYFTGNLHTEAGRHFGFELTFFRFALDPRPVARASAWATNQAWMAHLAVTDTDGGQFVAAERFSREALGLAGDQTNPFRIWLEDWSVFADGPTLPPLHLRAASDRAGLVLTLDGDKPPVSHGDGGMDPKGPELGNASHYYSLTRLGATGTLSIDGASFDVAGSAWMDREWGTSALSPELEGWDWFGLQLSDGRELMYYRLRTRDGASSPYSGGSLVQPDGTRVGLSVDDVVLTPVAHWTSPETRTVYPVSWQLSLPREAMTLTVRPYLAAQELNLTVRYWEGAVQVTGQQAGEALSGHGYTELTGYEEAGDAGRSRPPDAGESP